MRSTSSHTPSVPTAAAWLTRFVALVFLVCMIVPVAAMAESTEAPAEQEQPVTGGETPVTGTETVAPPTAPVTELPRVREPRERRAARAGRCHVTISPSSTLVAAGESVTLAGLVECASEEASAEQLVTVYEHAAGSSGFSVAGTATSASDGSFEVPAPALESNTVFYAVLQGAHSHHVKVKVSASVTISGPPEGAQLFTRSNHARAASLAANRVTFTGTVSPHDGGARVVLQRETTGGNEQWHRVALGQVEPDGTYSISHTFAIPGNVNIRVVVRARGRNRPGISETLSYVIAQHQNPKLTIEASADPLSFGETVTISGTGATAANQTLTLLGRTHTGDFQTLATTTADESGHYSFAEQSPAQNMYYVVRGAHEHSAKLFEGVRPLLSAEASANTVASGESVTFSGAVSPDHTGELIYLERRNPSGLGFHIVQTAQVGPESHYAIVQAISGGGTQDFRVKVPTDGESLAAASELLSVEVTAAAPVAASPSA